MRKTRIAIATRVAVASLLLLAASALGVIAAAGAQDSSGEKEILRMGWAQDPGTLNPFVGLDEEDYSIWALNWDLLVNFDPKTLTPAPGIAKDWDVSSDKKTITYHLFPGLKWSDGKPLTSADVKWSLEVLGDNGALFTSYTGNVTKIDTPDPETVVIHTKQPDARMIGGLFIYILPKHVYAKVPVKELTGDYKPQFPLVGSGPYIATDFERGKIVKMERNPHYRGDPGPYDEIQWIKYGNQDAVERALSLGEIDMVREVSAAGFANLGSNDNVDTSRSSSPSFTELAFNLCSKQDCPDARFNPAVQDRTVRQAIAYSIDREKLQAIATRGTSFVAHGLLPSFYKSFYEQPEQDYPFDPDKANQMLDDAGWVKGDDGVREKDGERLEFDIYARSESPFTIQDAKLIAEMGQEIGVKWNVQIVSTDKLTDLTIKTENGKPAPDFDTFVWGWGGDPYDPGFLLGLLTSDEIGGSSDSFYSNKQYDRLFEQQTTEFDTAKRKEIIARMIAIAQRDLPYLVLSEDPKLQAYRTDRINEIAPICPAETGDLFCDEVSNEGVLALEPIAGSSSSGTGTGASSGLTGLIGLLVGFAGGVIATRRRNKGRDEPLELPG
jgi:peptide/nickel transport system substrate-binding protein